MLIRQETIIGIYCREMIFGINVSEYVRLYGAADR